MSDIFLIFVIMKHHQDLITRAICLCTTAPNLHQRHYALCQVIVIFIVIVIVIGLVLVLVIVTVFVIVIIYSQSDQNLHKCVFIEINFLLFYNVSNRSDLVYNHTVTYK